ncbi:MAG: sortase (surface protein transpeptidase) [Cyclobacteriaceae bacterium]|jgi:sortase (surface protein transpeptidase)
MNKTAKIIISILVLVSVFFLLYAQIKTAEAQKYYLENQVLKAESEVQAQFAERLAADAVEAHNKAEAAERYAQEAMELVKKCQNSK